MQMSNQVSDDKLKDIAETYLKQNPNPNCGPKTLDGMVRALSNLKKRTTGTRYPIRPINFEWKLGIIDNEESYSEKEKGWFKKRFNGLIEKTASNYPLIDSLIHFFLVVELELKRVLTSLAFNKVKDVNKVQKKLAQFSDLYMGPVAKHPLKIKIKHKMLDF